MGFFKKIGKAFNRAFKSVTDDVLGIDTNKGTVFGVDTGKDFAKVAEAGAQAALASAVGGAGISAAVSAGVGGASGSAIGKPLGGNTGQALGGVIGGTLGGAVGQQGVTDANASAGTAGTPGSGLSPLAGAAASGSIHAAALGDKLTGEHIGSATTTLRTSDAPQASEGIASAAEIASKGTDVPDIAGMAQGDNAKKSRRRIFGSLGGDSDLGTSSPLGTGY